MADYNLGTARGKIELDASGAVTGAATANKATDSVTKGWQGASRGMVAAGGAMVAGAAVVAAGFGLAVNKAVDFEKQISAIGAVSGANSKQLEALRDKALQLGKDTAFSASESAQAMEELVKAGIPLEDVLNGAADAAVALAAAGGVDMPEAASQISNAMNAFNIAAKDVGGVADIIAGAANASAIDVGEFGMSLKQAGAVANLAGLSFKDTAVAIAEMGQAGIKGSDAGTSLKTFLSNLIPVTNKQKDAFKELGLVTEDGRNKFFKANGDIKNLAQIQQVLADATGDLTKQQKLATLETLFGSDAIRAAAVLSENGAAGYDKMAKAMGKVTAEGVAQKRLDNLAGQWEQLKGSLETMAIVIGSALIPALRQVVGWVTTLVNKFLELSPGMQKTILIIVGVTAAIVGVVGTIIAFAGAIGLALTALAPLAAALGIGAAALLGWIAVIPIIIAAVVALVVIIVKNWDTIKAKTVEVWNAIAAFFVSIWNTIKSWFSAAMAAIAGVFTAGWNALVAVVTTVFNVIATIVMTYVNIWRTIITTALNAIKAVWDAIWGTFGGLITAVWNLIVAIIRLALTVIIGNIRAQLAVIQAVFSTVWNAIKAVVSTVMNAIQQVLTSAWNTIKSVVTSVNNAIKSVILSVWNSISGPISSAVNAIKSVVSSGFNAVKETAVRIFNALKDGVVAIVQTLADPIRNAISTIKGLFSGASSWLVSAGKNIIQGLIDGITSMISRVTDTINGITDKISGFFPHSPAKEGPLKDKPMDEAGRELMKQLIDGMESSRADLKSALTKIADTLVEEGAGDKVQARFQQQTDRLMVLAKQREGIAVQMENANKALADIEAKYQQTVESISQGISNPFNLTGQQFEGIDSVDGFINTIGGMVGQARDFAAQIEALKAKGLDPRIIEQIAAAGVAGGSAAATALQSATAQQVTLLNSLQGDIQKVSNSIGTTVADDLYGSGIKAAQGLLKGLRSQRRAIIEEMEDIADRIARTLRRALQIHSPSRLTYDIGKFTFLGLEKGLEDYRKRALKPLDELLANISDTFTAVNAAAVLTPYTGAQTATLAPGLASAASALSAPAQAAVVTDARSFNLEAHTDADPDELMKEFAWASTVTLMGVNP